MTPRKHKQAHLGAILCLLSALSASTQGAAAQTAASQQAPAPAANKQPSTQGQERKPWRAKITQSGTAETTAKRQYATYGKSYLIPPNNKVTFVCAARRTFNIIDDETPIIHDFREKTAPASVPSNAK